MNDKNSVDRRSVYLNNLCRWGGSIPKGHRYGSFTFLILTLFLLQPTFTCQAQPLYSCCFETCLSLPFGLQYSPHTIIGANDGNGSLSLSNAGTYQEFDTCFYLVQVDSTGNSLWSRSLSIHPSEIHDSSEGDSVITTKYTYPTDIISDGQSGYYVSALRDSVTRTFDPDLGYYTGMGLRSFVLYKLNGMGELVWARRPSNNATMPLHKVVLHQDHIYGLAYSRNSSFYSPLDSSFHVTKLDTTGTPIWTKKVHTSGIVGNMDITMNANSLVAVATINNAINAVAFDLDGNVQWAKVFDSGYQDRLVGVVRMGDGYAIGLNRVDLAPHPIMLVIDSAGELLSSKSFMRHSNFNIQHFIPYDSNSVLMYQLGSTISGSPPQMLGQSDIWIIDQSNDVVLHERDHQWVIPVNSSYNSSVVQLTRSASGLLFLYRKSAFFQISTSTMTLPYIVQADSIGNTCAHRPSLSSVDSVSIESIQQSTMGFSLNDITLTSLNDNTVNEPFPIVVHSQCTGGVGVSEPEPVLPQVRVFPVPFSNTLNITAEQDQAYQLTLFDASSRTVDSYRFHGSTTVNTTDLDPGLYFYQIWSDNELVQSGKVLKQ
ncbi:MAG: T9SS type A sorting domain-containing protein [Flavobacteriales bacterium]|nr:T9SS type A sorting domain-containing protein [Flavobacteriales bacterium]MBK6944402.1 T9SS type A sorting domain-containing protein [Flavobacteriales bacterium]MBK7298057.1 T9SS type A sorting domain-containing protein [Flavobacteriales bacterium]MBK9534071.1 T9SS type A sorting domain-containing protein [Flavobacteriales bacterium]MBP9137461.1 T9SS type A sorting domain-containing protein [Flavobacteriales bacterium]